jgi:hypothetical protein
MRIRIPDLFDPGSVMEKFGSWIRNIGFQVLSSYLQNIVAMGGGRGHLEVIEGCHTVLGNSDGVERLCCLVLAIG